MPALLSLLVLTPVLVYLLIDAIRSAPEGYEDESGFHPSAALFPVRQPSAVVLEEKRIC
jgi:hypothetical protein